jgi:prefoldin subunit 5
LTETTNTRQNPQPSSQSDESGPSTKHNDKYLHSLDHRLAELSSIAPHTALIPTIVDDVNAVRAKADALDSFLAVRTGIMMQKMNDNEAALIRLQSQVSDLAAIAPSVNLAIPEINKNVNTLRARADAQEATLVVRTDVMVDKLKEMDLGVQLVTGKTQSIEKRMTSLENTMSRIETCLSTLVDRLDTASAVSSGDKDGDTEMRSNSPLPPGSSRAATGPFTAPRPPASRQVQVVPEQWDEVTSVQLATFGMTEHVAAMEQKINFLCTWTEDNTIHAPLAVLAADVEDIRLMLSSQGLYVPHRPMPLPSAPVLIPAQPRAQTTSSPSYTSPSNSNPVTNTTGNPPPNPYGIVDHAAATTRQQMKATTGRTDRIREANAESKGIPKDPGAEHSAYSLSRPPLSSRDDDPWTSLQNHLQMESRMRDEPVAGPSVPRGADALGNSDEKNGAVFFWWD